MIGIVILVRGAMLALLAFFWLVDLGSMFGV
jgi:hypothetical protein